MRKASIDRPWIPADQSFVVPSRAMPGFNLRVWRTDGRTTPPDYGDLEVLVHQPFKKTGVTHLRNYNASGHSSTFDVAVETLPIVLERPAAEAAALKPPEPSAKAGSQAGEAAWVGLGRGKAR